MIIQTFIVFGVMFLPQTILVISFDLYFENLLHHLGIENYA